MVVVCCDICRRELEPRTKGHYDWFSKGGVVVLVGEPGCAQPARLSYQGRDVNEACAACAPKCMARTWVKTGRDSGVPT